MVQWHTDSKRKSTGGNRRSVRASDKRLSQKGGMIAETKLGADKRASLKGKGNTHKVKLLQSKQANVVDEKGRITKSEIVTVKGNAANKLFVRRNIMTKGAVIEIKHGAENRLARITNRPGQTGTIESVLLPLEAAKEFVKERKEQEPRMPQKAKETQNTAKEAAKE